MRQQGFPRDGVAPCPRDRSRPPHPLRRTPLLVGGPMVLCGLLVAVLVSRETGLPGFAVGLALAVLPLPFLLGALRWAGGLETRPWRHMAFAFAWGSSAATLVALLAAGALAGWLTGDAGSIAPVHADTLELTVVAPVVEESAKAMAVLLLFLLRPRAFGGVPAGLVTAGITATGFAFTENILYLGTAFAQDRLLGASAVDSATVATFFVRIVVAPFAHPVFTALTGLGFGIAAALPPRRRAWRLLLPPLGLAAAMGLHAVWNAATSMPLPGFAAVYVLLMMPVFGLLCGAAVWTRREELRTLRETLPRYAHAGWLTAAEPAGLASPASRARARRLARREHGSVGVRAVAGYQAAATSLALLRGRADRGAAAADFAAREQELLLRLWHHREFGAAATRAAAAGARDGSGRSRGRRAGSGADGRGRGPAPAGDRPAGAPARSHRRVHAAQPPRPAELVGTPDTRSTRT